MKSLTKWQKTLLWLFGFTLFNGFETFTTSSSIHISTIIIGLILISKFIDEYNGN